MAVYITLLAFIFVIAVASSFAYSDKQERESFILKCGMIFIYGILALKKYTVGMDIPAYRQHYYLSKSVPWDNFDYIYFENGYIVLMKIFSKLNIDFQVFMIFIYTFVCITMYYFIKRYSKNVTLSLMIFICYQFFVFYFSGVRQTIAMSFCLIAYMCLDNRRWKKAPRILMYLGLIWLAATFHESAYIFLLVLPFEFMKMNKFYLFVYIPVAMTATFLRPVLLSFLKIFFKDLHTDGSVTLQGNFIFLALFTILSVIAIIQYKPSETTLIQTEDNEKVDDRFLFVAVNILITLVVLQLFFSGIPILRSTMYLTLFLIPGLTNILKCFESKIEIIATWVILIAFIYIFFEETLLKNQLNIMPYLMFWQ